MPHSEPTSRPSSSQAEREKKKSSKSSSGGKVSPASSSSGSKSSSSASSSSSSHTKRHDEEASSSSKTTLVSKGPPAVEALREIAGERVRHAKCAPEYLEAIAHRQDEQVKIVTGSEASAFFVKYLGENLDNDPSGLRSNKTRADSQAIVFAVTVWDYDRKCVDYYMTWRGKSKFNKLKEQEIGLLDDEFRRVARRIDRDYKVFRRAGSIASSASRHSHNSSKRDRSRSPSSPRKTTRPPKISPPSPHANLKQKDGQRGSHNVPEPPVSATSSVISLPYLNMIRGVPRGNRLPLMVTNPDRLSMLSEADVVLHDPEAIAAAGSENASPPTIAITPPDTHSQTHHSHDAVSSGLTPVMKSSSSTYSTETRSSRSSKSSQSDSRDSPELKEAKLENPDREPTEFLIILLGDKLDKEGLSWHGMERQTSVRSQHRSFTKDKASPWIGPLAKADIAPRPPRRRKSHGGNESDSDASYEEGGWKESPVVPLKPLLESLGFMPSPSDPTTSSPMSYSPGAPVIPHGYTPGSMMASPAPSHMMHLGGYPGSAQTSTPRSSMNVGSYVPAWIGGHSRSAGNSPAVSRPTSRVIPPMVYAGSPYLRPAY